GSVFTLGHGNLITALCRHNRVPEEGEDDGEMEPVKALDAEYYHSRFKSDPVINNQGGNVGRGVNEEEDEDQGLNEVMEEIDRFDGSTLPNQPQQGGG
ncbi:hypothetical protein A2U01_0073696, partial [Trifolium medium]|nr:hypothetical protein [Trifolium medium]